MADQNRVYDQENPDQNQDRLKPKEDLAPEHERQIATPQSHHKPLDQEDRDKPDKTPGQSQDEEENSGINEEPSGGFFRGGGGRSRSLLGLLSRRRALLVLAATGLAAVVFSFAGLLSVFKMDHIMSNIDTRSFARLNGSLDSRNTNYIRTYMELRLADVCPSSTTCDKIDVDKDNLIFKSENVQRSNNPVFNWYRSVRSGSFENDVFTKNGVIITSGTYRDGNQIRTRAVKISVKGNVANVPDSIVSTLQSGDWERISSASFQDSLNTYFNKEFFDTNSSRRKVIKQVVNDNTYWFQVFKRRQLRKDISNKTGSPKWRFFDDTRTKVDTKKIQIRNKIIDGMTGEGRTSKFVDCLFGISSCTFSSDSSNPVNEQGNPGSPKNAEQLQSEDGKEVRTIDYTDSKKAITTAAKGAGKFLNAASWAALINNFADIDKAITNKTFAGQVAIARGTQAMALYQMYETARDQLKTGNANSDQLNQFMQNAANITASEAWVKAIDGKGDPATLTKTEASREYCKADHVSNEKDFAYLCSDTIIGGTSRAEELSNAYNEGPGKVLHPILERYRKTFGWFGDAVNWVINGVAGPFTQGVLSALNAVAPSITNNIQSAIEWVTTKMISILGAGPIVGENSTTGQVGNWLVQGAAFSAESAARANGAAATTTLSHAAAQDNLAIYTQEQLSHQSFISRYLSPNNQESVVSNDLFAVGQIKMSSFGNIFTNLKSIFRSIGSAISLPLNRQAIAAVNNSGYAAAQVSGIDTYDWPPQCYNRNPLTSTPQNGTNIQSILGKKKVSDKAMAKLTWETVTDSQKWYQFLYDFKPSDQQAVRVYNCGLLDNAVLGGLGYTSGYTHDHGYDPATGLSAATPMSDGELPSGTAQDLAKQILQKNNISFTTSPARQAITDTSNGKSAQIESRCGAGDSAPLSATLLGVLLKIADKHKIGIGYLTNGCHSDGSAHYQGMAADLNSVDGRPSTGGIPDRAFMHEITGILPDGSGMGQSQCAVIPIDPINDISLFSDSCNHIHIEVAQ